MSGPVRFSLDVSSPFAAELLESFIEAGERHGVRTIWGHIEGESLELVASDEVRQDLVIQILEAKVKTHPSKPDLSVRPMPPSRLPAGAPIFPVLDSNEDEER